MTHVLVAGTLAGMTEEPVQEFTPADVARRVAALGVIINPATVWAFLHVRFEQHYPARAASTPPALLRVSEVELEEWLDQFLDTVEAERARLVRGMNPDLPS